MVLKKIIIRADKIAGRKYISIATNVEIRIDRDTRYSGDDRISSVCQMTNVLSMDCPGDKSLEVDFQVNRSRRDLSCEK